MLPPLQRGSNYNYFRVPLQLIAYASAPLIAALGAAILGSPAVTPLLCLSGAICLSAAILKLYRHLKLGILNFENFVITCYHHTVTHERVYRMAIIVFLALGHLWPHLSALALIPLGLLQGVTLDLGMQRRMYVV